MPTFIYPVSSNTPISSPFGKRPSDFHQGVDFAVSNGTPVHATATGRVILAGLSGGYGNLIEIDHGTGWQSRYGHLSAFQVSDGQTVTQGQVIALSGGIKGAKGSGDSTGPHLHFEIRHNGTAQNPIPLLGVPLAVTTTHSGSVATAQAFFNKTFPAYSHLTVDGIKGPKTTAVIKEFQRRVGIKDDGIIGPVTTAHMRSFGYEH